MALVYLGALFALAAYVDRRNPAWTSGRLRPLLYALGLGVYCTSWSFYGAVGFASANGWSFLAFSLGPILLLALFGATMRRVVRLAKAQNITSVADFIGARYGKSERVAALVALASIVSVVPYVALQLKAVAMSAAVMFGPDAARSVDPAFVAAVALAFFAMLFGTRQVAATERQDGLMAAVAVESLVKLVVFLGVGAFVTFALFDGPAALLERAAAAGADLAFAEPPDLPGWIALTLLSFTAFLLLPRQFHVAVVENREEADVGRAAWLFPAYLVAFSVFVAPMALAGLVTFGAGGAIAPDAFVLALPLEAGARWVAVAAFLGGLSAASAMVIVECVALSVMVSNDLAMPVMLRGRTAQRSSMTGWLLVVRRLAIAAVAVAAYGLHRLGEGVDLSALGLVALAAIAQLAPAFFGGLAWRRANARGALAGIAVGLLVWVWTLVLPAAAHLPSLSGIALLGGARLDWLAAAGVDPIARSVFLSLALNALVFVGVSLTRQPTPIERQQAAAFCGDEPSVETSTKPASPAAYRPWRSRATAGELVQTVARYLGPEPTEIAFRGFAIARGTALAPEAEADLQTVRFAEHLLASAIGAASSRLVLSMLLTKRDVTTTDALKLLDDASAAMLTSRDVLQNALDHARQGVTAIDKNMKLVCWNRQFRELFDLPEEMIHFGVGLDDIFRFNAARGLYGPIDPEPFIADRIDRFVGKLETLRTRLHPSGRVIEIRSARMPGGGVVTTYTDISDTVAAQEALERANETLERRVRERTRELTRLNQELARAKTEADEANISKTRFLAAASHDILQPLNAARLFATSLVERASSEPEHARLAKNVDSSLDAVEEILSTLLDISRLDTGAMRPELSSFRLDDITSQLAREFAPVAEEKGLRLTVAATSVTVRSDRRLLRRVLQNLVSNAIKYTPRGRVLVGVRRLKGRVRVEVWDTGLGIEPQQQKVVFREFKRLDQGAKVAPGLGLGLSIVERIARILDHPITLRSRPGKGSIFAIEAPVVAAMPALKVASERGLAPSPALAGLTVLAIDNEAAILEGMRTLLEGWGCAVLTASSQKEAEQVVRRRRTIPDVLLADYHLDDADGLEAIVALRWKFGSPIPAALITADRTPELRASAEDKRVTVLPKPIRPAALRALLAQTLAHRTAAE
ncbi:hybrid sensor histidine kinase/response regulator [Hansschlegelia zhihuaiae]|uniref:histidine kinase n=2 Tax=Hansschlegelia zhihuaiae TaxID=405005 RepID=A0A4Q0MCD9_9HYPH|nr:PAS domain-containing hybrid sensor histidine kinase/response regulator [Hansschlegelia zhihuaiae]RXF70865.1 hybrid sensor histidine kinase/response regulator [Hansschlegelia zhihuaiae]